MTLALLLANVSAISLVIAIAWHLGKRRARRDWDTTVELVEPLTLDCCGLPCLLDGVEVFMRAAGQHIATHPAWPDEDTRELRARLLAEEYAETMDADYDDNLAEYVDGLLDVIVIAWGSLLTTVGPEAAYAAAAEVTRSNLDKIGPDGTVLKRRDGKVLKPEGWTGPDLVGVLAAHGYRQETAA